ncbi:MAG: TraV family lipoprotein [Rubrivivax sp.]|nr:TraV family lipoprotein [Rubrivivax sp.]
MYRVPASAMLAAVASFAMSACTNMSGLGGESKFKCLVPDGVPCMSMSEVDSSYRGGVLPGQHRPPEEGAAKPVAQGSHAGTASPKAVTTASAVSTGAIRTQPTIIRIWIAPWEDVDGDLNDQGYVYLQIDAGRWLIEHNRERIRRTFAPAQAGAAPQRPARPLLRATSSQTPASGQPTRGTDEERQQ